MFADDTVICTECMKQAAENLCVNERAPSRGVTLQEVKNTQDEINECSEREYEVSWCDQSGCRGQGRGRKLVCCGYF